MPPDHLLVDGHGGLPQGVWPLLIWADTFDCYYLMALQGHVFVDAGIVQSLAFAVAQQAAAFAAHVAASAAAPARLAAPIICPCGT